MSERLTPCVFHTNVDLCKRFMPRLSGAAIAPNVGDLVEVYRDTGKLLHMEVVRRVWRESKDPGSACSGYELHCELHLDNIWRTHGIEALERWFWGK